LTSGYSGLELQADASRRRMDRSDGREWSLFEALIQCPGRDSRHPQLWSDHRSGIAGMARTAVHRGKSSADGSGLGLAIARAIAAGVAESWR